MTVLGPRELNRALLARQLLPRREVRPVVDVVELLLTRIGDDLEALSNATNTYVPLVQLPPRGVWGAGGQARYARAMAAFAGADDVRFEAPVGRRPG